MTLRMPLAATAAAVLTLLLAGAFLARPASAHTIPDAPAAIEVHDTGADQLAPATTNDDTDQAWIWIGVGIFIIFAIFALLFAVFGYLEATRRE